MASQQGSEKQATKIFCGGLSWTTDSERLRAYFENFGVVREAFVSYNKSTGRPRGFGFVVFESQDVADKVVATKHTIDRREVECKRAVPKEDAPAAQGDSLDGSATANGSTTPGRTRKVFVGGLAPGVDEKVMRQYFEQFGPVEDAVVMYDHENKRPRGFGFVTFAQEECVEKVFAKGAMQTILDKQIEIKPAVPRDQMPAPAMPNRLFPGMQAPGMGRLPTGNMYGNAAAGFNVGMPGFNLNARTGFPGAGRGGGQQAGYAGFQALTPGRGGTARMPPDPGMQQAYNNAGFGGNRMQLGGGKLPPGYEQLYAASLQSGNAGFGHTPAASLYNLTGFQPQLNSLQNATNKLNAAAFANPLNLKTLGALASLGFPGAQHTDNFVTEGTGYASQDQDYADAAAAVAAANTLAVQPDYTAFQEAGFNTAPAPGWSS